MAGVCGREAASGGEVGVRLLRPSLVALLLSVSDACGDGDATMSRRLAPGVNAGAATDIGRVGLLQGTPLPRGVGANLADDVRAAGCEAAVRAGGRTKSALSFVLAAERMDVGVVEAASLLVVPERTLAVLLCRRCLLFVTVSHSSSIMPSRAKSSCTSSAAADANTGRATCAAAAGVPRVCCGGSGAAGRAEDPVECGAVVVLLRPPAVAM